jgi:hypothetical protein
MVQKAEVVIASDAYREVGGVEGVVLDLYFTYGPWVGVETKVLQREVGLVDDFLWQVENGVVVVV